MNESGTGASFRAKSNITALITTALIYPVILIVSLSGQWNVFALAGLLTLGVVMQTVIMIAVHIILAIATKQEPDDERDEDLARRASHFSGTVLTSGVVVVLLVMLARAMIFTANNESASVDLWPMYGIFSVLIISELVRYAVTARGYRVS